MENVSVVAGIVIHNKRILLIKRAKSPVKFHWNIPGGRVEADESPEKALAREIKEELDISIKVGKFCYEAKNTRGSKNYHLKAFYCDIIGKFKPAPNPKEILKWNLLTFDEAQSLQLTDHVKNILLPKLKNENKID